MRTSCAAIVCGVLAAAGTIVLAQQATPTQDPQQQQPPVFRGRTDVVQLDVSVLDKKRRPVHGLKASDFTIKEDGQLQKIVTVTEIAEDDEFVVPVWQHAAPPDVATNEVGDKRLFAILVDGSRPPPLNAAMPGNVLSRRGATSATIDGVVEIVHAIIDRMRGGDMAAIISGSCAQSFTGDREKLLNAIDSLLPNGPPCKSVVGPRNPARVALAERSHWLIRNLAEYLLVVPQRRKAVIVIGGGTAKRPSGRGRIDPLRELQETLWFAQMANVNVYQINPQVLTPQRGAMARLLDDIRTIAEDTGGFAITDPAKYDAGLDQIFEETGSYYILGYQTTHPEMDGRFRKLSVKVAGHGDVTIGTRSMWFRPKVSPDAAPADAPVTSKDTSLSLAGLLPDLDVGFNAVGMPFGSTTGGWPSVALVTELREPVLQGTTRVRQRMNLRMLAYAEGGELRTDVTTEAHFDDAPATEDHVRYAVFSRLDLPPGRYAIRLVAQNPASEKLGSTEFDIVVPDFAREVVSLSGVALFAASVAPPVSFGTLDPFLSLPATAVRLFTTSDKVSAFVRVYQGGSEAAGAVTLTARVVDAAGKVVSETIEAMAPARFGASRSADYTLSLPLHQLRAGPYLLTIEAALGARRTPRRDVRFAIR